MTCCTSLQLINKRNRMIELRLEKSTLKNQKCTLYGMDVNF